MPFQCRSENDGALRDKFKLLHDISSSSSTMLSTKRCLNANSCLKNAWIGQEFRGLYNNSQTLDCVELFRTEKPVRPPNCDNKFYIYFFNSLITSLSLITVVFCINVLDSPSPSSQFMFISDIYPENLQSAVPKEL